MAPKTLLLWDIDQTLVWTGGAGERALVIAADEICRQKLNLAEIPYSGRTDRWIAKRILEHLQEDASDANQNKFQEAYLTNLEKELPHAPAYILPGVQQILDTIAKDASICQALLTGNLERGAKLKLTHLKLWDYFPFGGFADFSPNRNDLSAHALALAEKSLETTFDRDRVFVIGDTPYDVECGQAINAKTIAVGTGSHSMEALAASKPDFLLPSLENTEAFLKIVV